MLDVTSGNGIAKECGKSISVLCCLARTLTSPIDPFIGFI